MKTLKTFIISFLLLSGAAMGFTSCEEEIIAPQGEKLGTSSEAGGMEDDGQFD